MPSNLTSTLRISLIAEWSFRSAPQFTSKASRLRVAMLPAAATSTGRWRPPANALRGYVGSTSRMGRKRVESHGRIARHEEPAKRRHQKGFGILEEDIRRRSSIGSRLSESAQKLHGNPEVLPNPTEPTANGRRMGCAHGGHHHSRTLLVEAPSSAGQGRLVAGEHGADRLRRNPRLPARLAAAAGDSNRDRQPLAGASAGSAAPVVFGVFRLLGDLSRASKFDRYVRLSLSLHQVTRKPAVAAWAVRSRFRRRS